RRSSDLDAILNKPDIIWSLRFDSDNNVIGVGNSKSNQPQEVIDCFAFKYNLLTNNILWINELDSDGTVREFYRTIIEKTAGENYLVIGETNDLQSGGTGCDALIIELDRNTGNEVWQRNLHYGSCETYFE